MPLAVLLYPLVLKAGPPASDVPKALLTVVATAVVHTKTSADWALWKAVSQAEAFWSHITAAEYEAVLLPSITQVCACTPEHTAEDQRVLIQLSKAYGRLHDPAAVHGPRLRSVPHTV